MRVSIRASYQKNNLSLEKENCMKKTLIFKSKSGAEYVYDSRYNIVYSKKRLYDDNFQKKLRDIQKNIGVSSVDDSIDRGELNEDKIKNYVFRNGLKEFLLEVTTGCNMRCNYCVFSQNYSHNRDHGNKLLSYEQALKSIKFYLDLCEKARSYNPNIKPMIGFYGGEPLLNYQVIKDIIIHLKNEDLFKDIQFTITTNGLLLDEDRIDFLIGNDVIVLFSLDGPKSQHDRSRVDANGNGTFDDIMENINKYIEKKGYAFTNSVYDFRSNFREIASFFDSHSKIMSMAFSPVNDNDTTYYDMFSEKEMMEFQQQLDEIYLDFFNEENLSDSKTEDFLINWITKNSAGVMTRVPFDRKSGLINYTGGCVPADKMFANIDGDILICEKLNNSYKIGSIDDGLDYKKIIKIVNDYNDATKKCKNCVLNKMCSICLATCGSNGSLLLTEEKCREERRSIKQRLEIAYTILEKNGNWFEVFNNNYQKELRGGW